MGATIKWEPAERNARSIDTCAPQHLLRVLANMFGEREYYILEGYDRLKIEGAIAALADDDEMKNTLAQINHLIETHKSIRIWAKY